MRGGTRKRGGTWTWHLGVADPATGRWRQLTKGGFRTRREAQAALNEAMAALRAGTFVAPSRLTLGAFLTEQWLPTVRAAVRPTTWTTYRIYAEAHIIPALGQVPLQVLTASHLNRLYADLAKHGRRDGRGGLKPKSVRHVHVLLHKALCDAMRWGLVARNVADVADPPRVPRTERAVWSADELRTFLEATSGDRLAAMWLLSATTGMRRSELLGLPWRAVDLEATPGRLAVVQVVVVVDKQPAIVAEAKTASSHRQLALDPFTVVALKAHRVRQLEERLAWGPAWTDTGLMFTREDGQVLHPEHITKRFARLVRDAGLPPITLHGVRHSYATAALAAGEPLKVVSERVLDFQQLGSTGLHDIGAQQQRRFPFGVGELGSRGAAVGVVKQLLQRLGPSLLSAPTRQLGDRPGLVWSTAARGELPQHPLHGGQHETPSPT